MNSKQDGIMQDGISGIEMVVSTLEMVQQDGGYSTMVSGLADAVVNAIKNADELREMPHAEAVEHIETFLDRNGYINNLLGAVRECQKELADIAIELEDVRVEMDTAAWYARMDAAYQQTQQRIHA